ncbi:MAG: methylamine utilization protein [Flavobacteriales bacterium]|nr:methylamine utilization protein [Flavobacteriales bacterium]
MKKTYFLVSLFLFLAISCKKNVDLGEVPFSHKLENQYKSDLDSLFNQVTVMQSISDIDSLKIQFKKARLQFKKIEPILSFYKKGAYNALNHPNLAIVHEDSNGVVNEKPIGFQVLEEELFAENINTENVKNEINTIHKTLKLELNNIHFSNFKEYHFLWMVKDEITRIMSLGITGFDSPVINYSLEENKAVLLSLNTYLELYQDKFNNPNLYNNWNNLLKKSIKDVDNAKDFNSFNRYAFIKNQIEPMLKLWKKTVVDWKVEFPFDSKVLNDADSFFSENTFSLNAFRPNYAPDFTKESAELGKKLFYEKKLSGNETMSCATCHVESRYFTDGLAKAKANDGSKLDRNSPTLYYAGLQSNQFHDARATNLESQILEVTNNKKEFHSDVSKLVKVANENEEYKKEFNKIYKNGINERNVRNAIANYIRTLKPFSSKFDKNISGKENNYSEEEINGFNLFAGKAKCATCHFIPIFNGTVPPDFSDSELEVLGIPEKSVWKNATVDSDLGRYNLFGAELKKYAFKTPTIRNIAKTAPYMHNGVYKTLEEVIKFYNVGGGHGIGINLENQTLPSDSLNLSEKEQRNLILFLKSLTDNVKY